MADDLTEERWHLPQRTRHFPRECMLGCSTSDTAVMALLPAADAVR